MADAAHRLTAVIAALEKVREHVDEMERDDVVHPDAYNRWVEMLEGAVEGNWSALQIHDTELAASEYLMHLDAAIAFLKAHNS